VTSPTSARVRRLPWWVWVIAVIAALVGIVAALGGFGSIPESKLPKIPLGEKFTGGEVSSVVERVWVSNQLPTNEEFASEGEQFLIVQTRLENVKNLPSQFVGDALRVEVPGVIEATTDPDNVLDQLRGTHATFLPTGIETTIDFIWVIPDGSIAEGDTVYLGILDQFRVYGDPTFGDGAFTRPQPVALLETTIVDVETVEPPEELTF